MMHGKNDASFDEMKYTAHHQRHGTRYRRASHSPFRGVRSPPYFWLQSLPYRFCAFKSNQLAGRFSVLNDGRASWRSRCGRQRGGTSGGHRSVFAQSTGTCHRVIASCGQVAVTRNASTAGTGFSKLEREELQHACMQLGARYLPDLVHSSTSPHCHTTVLICKTIVDAFGTVKYTR